MYIVRSDVITKVPSTRDHGPQVKIVLHGDYIHAFNSETNEYCSPSPAYLVSQIGNDRCPADHGERTNKKLIVQPFYQRGRNGKMKKY